MNSGFQQVDLFSHGIPNVPLQDLKEALAGGKSDLAARILESEDQNEDIVQHRDHASILIRFLQLPKPEDTHAGIRYLERIEEITPSAIRLLGRPPNRLLSSAWKRVARALEGKEFDPSHPELHASRAYREIPDWNGVKRVISVETDFGRKPELLHRMAEAEYHLNNHKVAYGHWLNLCHLSPDHFESRIESLDFPDPDLQNLWYKALDQELTPEITPEWFPAWLLLEEPGIVHGFTPSQGDDASVKAYQTILDLRSHVESDEVGIELRTRLQSLHSGLLKLFLQKRVVLS